MQMVASVAAPRPHPAVHPVVRHRRTSQGAAGCARVSASRCISTPSRRSARLTRSCSKPLTYLGFRSGSGSAIIIVPSAAPQVLVGLRQSLAIAWLTLIVAEQINADKGIGFLINNARDFLRIDIIIFGLDRLRAARHRAPTPSCALWNVARMRYRVMTVLSERQTGTRRRACVIVDKWYGRAPCARRRLGRRRSRAKSSRSSAAAAQASRPCCACSGRACPTDHTGERMVTGAARAGLSGATAVPVARLCAPTSCYGLTRNKLQPRTRPPSRADRALGRRRSGRPRRRLAA